MNSDEDKDPELDFAILDALLDQALDLTGSDRLAFLTTLPVTQRQALENLLAKSEVDLVEPVGQEVNRIISQANAKDPGQATTAGDWALKQEIGSGGMGQVFYAERTGSDGATSQTDYTQRGAVKILWSHRVSDQFRDRFYRERRILASIDHPGLARFLDGGLLDDGRPWFAMEYVEGQHITDYAQAHSIGTRISLFLDVCDTIEYAHQRLILHRDIKPNNILVDASGRARVLDFGVAKILDDVDDSALTETGGTPLTLQYASPEQVSGKHVDVASDVYQLGLLLYQLLTGERPYDLSALALTQAIRLICEQDVEPPSTRATSIEPDLDAIVAQAIQKSPSARYRSAAMLADDLRRYLTGQPVQARPQSTWYVLNRFVRRNALLVGICAASAIALTVATLFSLGAARDARAEAARSRATQEILTEVFTQADPYGDSGADTTLAQALVNANPAISERVQDDPRLAWEVHKTLADIFMSLDLVTLETEAYQAAWTAAEQMSAGNERERLFAIAGIGNVLARTDPNTALAHFSTHLPHSPAAKESVRMWLSAKYAQIGAWIRLRNYQQADEHARHMAKVAQRFDVQAPQTLARINQLLAGAARRAGDQQQADHHWQLAVDHSQAAGAPHAYAINLSNAALHYGMSQRYEQADSLFQQSIAVFRDAQALDSSYANVLRTYAGLRFRMGDPQGAIDRLEEALQILDPADNAYGYFVAQRNAAEFHFATGNATAAWQTGADALSVALEHFGTDSEVTERILPILARAALFADRGDLAAELLALEPAQRCAATGVRDAFVLARTTELADNSKLVEERRIMRQRFGSTSTDTADVAAQLATYDTVRPLFFDALDDRYFLTTIASQAKSSLPGQPVDLNERIKRLQLERAALSKLLDDPTQALHATADEAPKPCSS